MPNKTNQADLPTQFVVAVLLAVGLIGMTLVLNTAPANAQTEDVNWIQLGSDIDGEATNDLSGGAVAMSYDGKTLVVGSVRNDGGGTNSGSARVLRWDGSSWKQLGADIDGEAERDQSGTAVAISATGDTVAIGAPNNDGTASNAGHVRVHRFIDGAWVQLGLDIDGEAANDLSGSAVALSAGGDTVVVGAFENDGNGERSGHARVYRWSGEGWVQLGADIDGEDEFDTSGESVAISGDGDTVAIGASRAQGDERTVGHVRVFRWTGGTTWVQVGADIDGLGFVEQAGRAVAISADANRVIVGAPGYELNTTFRGGARVYEWDGAGWGQLGSVITGERVFDLAGSAVAMSGDGRTVAVGSIDNSDAGNFNGHARLFGWDGADWAQLGEDLDGETTNDFFGQAIAMSEDGRTAVVGAMFNDGNGANAGHVRVYRDTEQPVNPVCNGLAVTVNLALGQAPTDGDDVIRGTTGPDTIDGLGGRDTICGLQGADTIDAGDGFDTVFGGSGDDMIAGGSGNDLLIGGRDDDSVAGGMGNDRIQGGDGNDVLDGDGGFDTIQGGNGDDVIRGGTHDDRLSGNLGRDDISGDGGDDILRGGAWLDTMNGGAGVDGCTLVDPSGNVEVRVSCETGVFRR